MDRYVEEFESLKKTIDDLRVRQLSDQREKERLEGELEQIKIDIRSEYGVEIEDFEKAIGDLQQELDRELAALKDRISECKEKMQ